MQRLVIPFKTLDQKQKCLQIKTKSSLFKKRYVKTWTAEQDQRLVALHKQYPKKWNIISEHMRNRNQNQCLHRFRRICQLGQNKKIWSVQEDQTVLKMMNKVGPNWKVIAQTLGTKTGKQIRERFINKLDPKIRRQQWTQQQDLKIIQLYSKLGSKWCQISKCLPGRPENKIKNRFYSFIQKNYQFKVKQNFGQEQQSFGNKQNSPLTAGVRSIDKKQSEHSSIQRKSSSVRILEEKKQNIQQQRFEYGLKQEKQESEMIDEQGEKNYNSMKQINDQCFYKYQSEVNNNDLLYFEDN